MADKILVRATAAGFYFARRSAGDEFAIPEELFAGEWMERVEPPAPPAPEPEPAPEPAPAPEPDKAADPAP